MQRLAAAIKERIFNQSTARWLLLTWQYAIPYRLRAAAIYTGRQAKEQADLSGLEEN